MARDPRRHHLLCGGKAPQRHGFAGLPREAVDRAEAGAAPGRGGLLSQHSTTWSAPARFDVAEVYTDEVHRPLRLEYLENAF